MVFFSYTVACSYSFDNSIPYFRVIRDAEQLQQEANLLRQVFLWGDGWLSWYRARLPRQHFWDRIQTSLKNH
jgi:hypothetical protein